MIAAAINKIGIAVDCIPTERPLITIVADPAFWLIGHRHYSIQKLVEFGSNVGLLTKSVQIKGRVYELVALFNLYISKWIFRRSPFFEHIIDKKLNELIEKIES